MDKWFVTEALWGVGTKPGQGSGAVLGGPTQGITRDQEQCERCHVSMLGVGEGKSVLTVVFRHSVPSTLDNRQGGRDLGLGSEFSGHSGTRLLLAHCQKNTKPQVLVGLD